jgi:hypothetical protein
MKWYFFGLVLSLCCCTVEAIWYTVNIRHCQRGRTSLACLLASQAAVRATPPVHCTANLRWREVKKTCRLASAKWYGPAFLHRKEAEAQLAKGTAKLTPADYYSARWLARWFDWSRWVAITSFPPFALRVSVLRVKLGKNANNFFLNVRNTIAGSQWLSRGGAALTAVVAFWWD